MVINLIRNAIIHSKNRQRKCSTVSAASEEHLYVRMRIMADEIAQNGWTAVPVDAAKILQDKPYLHEPAPLLVSDIPFPSDDPVVARVQQYVKEKLPEQTYNHSLRVYYFGEPSRGARHGSQEEIQLSCRRPNA